jgi:hypothetical protein
MKQSGECSLHRIVVQILRRYRFIPRGLVTSSTPGQGLVDNIALLVTREAEFKLDTNNPFKIYADTDGVCESLACRSLPPFIVLCVDRVLYTPTRLAAIANEAAKPESIFSLSDRIVLVHDALGKAPSECCTHPLSMSYGLRMCVPESRLVAVGS